MHRALLPLLTLALAGCGDATDDAAPVAAAPLVAALPTGVVDAPVVVDAPAIEAPLWMAPVNGRVTQQFGARDDGTLHDAVDIACPLGTEVKAPTELVVRYIGYRNNAGRFVLADTLDGAYELTFAHLSHVEIFEGDRVAPGDVIGLSGISGNVTGPHLHFRVERVVDGAHTPIDPLPLMDPVAP